jgi:hypothetical protein
MPKVQAKKDLILDLYEQAPVLDNAKILACFFSFSIISTIPLFRKNIFPHIS